MKTIILSALAAATPLVVQGNSDMADFFRIVGGNNAERGDYPYYGKNFPFSFIPMAWRNGSVSNVISFSTVFFLQLNWADAVVRSSFPMSS